MSIFYLYRNYGRRSRSCIEQIVHLSFLWTFNAHASSKFMKFNSIIIKRTLMSKTKRGPHIETKNHYKCFSRLWQYFCFSFLWLYNIKKDTENRRKKLKRHCQKVGYQGCYCCWLMTMVKSPIFGCQKKNRYGEIVKSRYTRVPIKLQKFTASLNVQTLCKKKKNVML